MFVKLKGMTFQPIGLTQCSSVTDILQLKLNCLILQGSAKFLHTDHSLKPTLPIAKYPITRLHFYFLTRQTQLKSALIY
jgi:hypothetical protein